MSLGCLYCSGECVPGRFLPDGTAKLPGVPFTSLLSFLIDGENLESREGAGEPARGCSPQAAPGLQGMRTSTHVLQQRLLPHGLHQALGVHVAQAQDVQGATVCAKRGVEGHSVGNAGNRVGQSRDETSPRSEKEGQAVAHHSLSLRRLLRACPFLRRTDTNYGERNRACAKSADLQRKGN